MSISPSTTEPWFERRSVGRATMDLLFASQYEELRGMARRQLLREREGHTLSPTALVHEAYLRLVDIERMPWQDRAHVLAMAGRAMRRVLVDHARRRRAERRGGGHPPLSWDDRLLVFTDDGDDRLLGLEQALARLAEINPRLTRVVECRFFAGMTEVETAEALGVTTRTVQRDWFKARGWLSAWLEPVM